MAEPLPVVNDSAVARVVSADVGARVTRIRRVAGFVGNEDFLVDTATGGYVLKAGAATDVAGEAWACQRVRRKACPHRKFWGSNTTLIVSADPMFCCAG